MTRRRAPNARLTAGVVAAAFLVAGCSGGGGGGGDGIGAAANGNGDSGGNKSLQQIPPAQRGAPMDVSGTLLTGQPWSTADAKGKVVILNVWGSWCGPCQAEFPELQKAWTTLQAAKKPAVLMGVNYGDSAATAMATVKQRGLSYPSLKDNDGKTLLSLGKSFTNAPPVTMVLDTRHRLAALVIGATNDTTLLGLVDDTLTGK